VNTRAARTIRLESPFDDDPMPAVGAVNLCQPTRPATSPQSWRSMRPRGKPTAACAPLSLRQRLKPLLTYPAPHLQNFTRFPHDPETPIPR